MTLDSILKSEALKQIKADHKENIAILKNTFKISGAYFDVMEENTLKMYDRFLELFPLEKEKHELVLLYVTSRYYNQVTDSLIQEYKNTKQLPEAIIESLSDDDVDYYVKAIVKKDSRRSIFDRISFLWIKP